MAKQVVKERWDVKESNCLKGVSGKVIVDEKRIKHFGKEYMEKLMKRMNGIIENRLELKDRPADCTRNDEVAAVLKKMKRQACQG